jgi:hypothetical protein
VATPTVATPTDSIYIVDEPWDALQHDIVETTLSVAIPTVATPTSIPNQVKRSIETPYDTILTTDTESRDTNKSFHINSGHERVRHKTRRWQIDAERREWAQNYIYIAFMSPGKPQDKTPTNVRLASSRRRLKIHEPRETTTYNSKTTPSVATPTQDVNGSEHEPGSPENTKMTDRGRASPRVSTRRRLNIPFLRT